MKLSPKHFAVGLLTMAFMVGASAMAHDTDKGGEQIIQTYDLTGFYQIRVGGVFEVDVKVGPAHSISLKGDSHDMERAEVSVEDGRLILGMKKQKGKYKKHNHSDGITATITLPSLQALRVSGVASGDIEGVDSEEFDLRVSGVAEVDISGTCGMLDAKVSGVGELDAKDLKCRDADVVLSGVGEMSVYASESIDVTASGVGSVNVYGNPKKVDKTKSFFTDISIK